MKNNLIPVCAALLAVACSALLTLPVAAEEADQQREFFGVGLAVLVDDEGYRGADNDTRVVPAIFYERGRFFFRGREVGYTVLDDDRWQLDALARVRFDGYEASDSPFLQGMDDRDPTIDGGIAASASSPVGDWQATLLTDLAGRHEGLEASVRWNYSWGSRRWSLGPAVTITWQDDSLANYYYGVTPQEATLARPAWDADSSVNLTLGASGRFSVTRQHMFLLNIGVTRLDDPQADSPLVDNDRELGAQLIWIYSPSPAR